ncbi:MAG: hypothetical protein IPJ78_12240 [Gemmatimonadetes bacterium]|nr:hypothetical protein [Gemmatimonadota bacterium]
MPRSLSFVLRVLSALLAVACNVATPQKPSNPTVSGGRCQTVASVNWKAAIGDNIYINPDSADVMMPEDLKTCTVHFGTVDVPHRIESPRDCRRLHTLRGWSHAHTLPIVA